MNFKDKDFSNVPAFDQFRNRLKALRPAYIPVKAGYEFDVEFYRVYVEKPSSSKLPIDISEKLLRDFKQNPHEINSNYTKELISKLDALIVAAIPERDQL